MTTAIDSVARNSAANMAQVQAQPMKQAPAAHAGQTKLPGIDANDFLRDHRIHVKHGSLFEGGPMAGYLALHRGELVPANEAPLREKLTRSFTASNPSFYESSQRRAVALALAQIVPLPLEAQHAQQLKDIKEYNAQVDGAPDPRVAKPLDDRHAPMAANARDVRKAPASDEPVGKAELTQGLIVYMLMREKLTRTGHTNELVSYLPASSSVDVVLSALGDKMGVPPLALREAAAKGGIDGIAATLGIDAGTTGHIKQICSGIAEQGYALNPILNWQKGRQIPHATDAGIGQLMQAGLAARIDETIARGRATFGQQYDTPESIKLKERRVVQGLGVLEPIQRALMHKLGAEVCYSPDFFPADIAFYGGIKGLNRGNYRDPAKREAAPRIYFSAYDGLEESDCILAHEAAHMFWPGEFSPEAVQKIDALAASDATRFKGFKRLVDEKFPEFQTFLHDYQKAGSDAERTRIAQTTKAAFAGYGVSIDEGVLPYLRDANQFRYLVDYANEKLHVEGGFYTGSSYSAAPERFREVLSRFAELKQVRVAGNPQLMQFLSPGLNEVWENHYIPHLHRVYQKVVAAEQTRPTAPAAAAHAAEAPISSAAPATVAACEAHRVPDTKVQANTIEMGPRTQAALDTLSAMGISSGR